MIRILDMYIVCSLTMVTIIDIASIVNMTITIIIISISIIIIDIYINGIMTRITAVMMIEIRSIGTVIAVNVSIIDVYCPNHSSSYLFCFPFRGLGPVWRFGPVSHLRQSGHLGIAQTVHLGTRSLRDTLT